MRRRYYASPSTAQRGRTRSAAGVPAVSLSIHENLSRLCARNFVNRFASRVTLRRETQFAHTCAYREKVNATRYHFVCKEGFLPPHAPICAHLRLWGKSECGRTIMESPEIRAKRENETELARSAYPVGVFSRSQDFSVPLLGKIRELFAKLFYQQIIIASPNEKNRYPSSTAMR